jgi:thioredoxin 2
MQISCSACAAINRVPAKRLRDKAKCARCKEPLLPLAKPVALSSEADFDELVREAPGAVLVDFWAAWCGPCRMVAPELEKVARRRSAQLVVAKVDTEALPHLSQRFAIRSIPTMILFRSGAEARRLSGAMPAAEIEKQLALEPLP